MFFGFTPVCPGKMISLGKKWAKLSLWLPTWASIVLAAPVRFIMLIFYFFYVTFAQVIAHISNFTIGVKNWFDNLIFGGFYASIKFLWNNPFVFFAFFGIGFILILAVYGTIWVWLTTV